MADRTELIARLEAVNPWASEVEGHGPGAAWNLIREAIAALRADGAGERDQSQRAAEFAALWAWREDANPKVPLSDAERLSAIRWHPDIKVIAGRSALSQPAQFGPANESRPIESAPRDGTRILVYRPGARIYPEIEIDWWGEKGWAKSSPNEQPTRWWPLPKPETKS